jgi:hypothetical protein
MLAEAAFVVLVALPVAYHSRDLPDRARDLRDGARGVLAAPLSLAALLGSALLLLSAGAFSHPVLGWGWLGANVVVEPLVGPGGSGGAVGAAASPSAGPVEYAAAAAAGGVLLGALVLFNYLEEKHYRGSWRATAVWAALHPVMGVPLAAAGPIFAAGAVYKAVHDRWGLEEAYVAHLGTNLCLVALVVAAAA